MAKKAIYFCIGLLFFPFMAIILLALFGKESVAAVALVTWMALIAFGTIYAKNNMVRKTKTPA